MSINTGSRLYDPAVDDANESNVAQLFDDLEKDGHFDLLRDAAILLLSIMATLELVALIVIAKTGL